MWTRICNLQAEANLPPLHTRIQIKNTHTITKTLLQRPNSYLAKRIKEDLHKHPDLPKPNTYTTTLLNCIEACGMSTTIAQIQADSPDPNFSKPAPWEPFPANIIYTKLPLSKSNCSPATLKASAETTIAISTQPGGITYYTDGTVDPITGSTGAGVYSSRLTASWRTSNSCSTLQTELTAIRLTLQYSLQSEEGPVTIITDSKSSLQALQQKGFRENKNLLSNIIHLLHQHQRQGRPVNLSWIPSHINIHGNDMADEMAKNSLSSTTITTHIQPSLSQYKNLTNHIPKKAILNNLNHWINQGSASSTWYKNTTKLTPPPIDRYTPRNLAVIISRLRLGYKCCWEVVQPREMQCQYCDTSPCHPLYHYLLECPTTHTFRTNLNNLVQASHPNAAKDASIVAQHILSNLDTHQNTLTNHPPPR